MIPSLISLIWAVNNGSSNLFENLMIGHVTAGTYDLPRSAAIFDALLAEISAKRTMELERGILWGVAQVRLSLGVLNPFDGNPAIDGNLILRNIYATPDWTLPCAY